MTRHTPPPLPQAPQRPPRSWGRWLAGLSLLATMIGGGAWGVAWLRGPQTLPIEVVHIGGELRYLSRANLEQVVARELNGGFFSLDLEGLQAAVSGVPWVAQASVRRLWPNRIELQVRERRPAARWSGQSLVTAEGEVFHPQANEIPEGLPNLVGPDQGSAPRLLLRYQQWQDLVGTRGLKIEELKVDARGAWSLRFQEGLRLELGKSDVPERLARFLNVLPQLQAQPATPERIDLRYGNGLAVQWRAEATTEPERPKPQTKGRASSRVGTRNSGRT